jgi:hypothetical protein
VKLVQWRETLRCTIAHGGIRPLRKRIKSKAGTEIMRTKTKIRDLDWEASRSREMQDIILREAGNTVTQRHIKRYVHTFTDNSNRFIYLSSNQLSTDKSNPREATRAETISPFCTSPLLLFMIPRELNIRPGPEVRQIAHRQLQGDPHLARHNHKSHVPAK